MNASIHTCAQHNKDMDIIKIIGVLVDILLEIVPNIYEACVTTYIKGVKQLVVQCQNSIYVTIMSSILYYHNFRKSLELEDMNSIPTTHVLPARSCNNKQMTICFHVKDFKLSHKIPKVVVKEI